MSKHAFHSGISHKHVTLSSLIMHVTYPHDYCSCTVSANADVDNQEVPGSEWQAPLQPGQPAAGPAAPAVALQPTYRTLTHEEMLARQPDRDGSKLKRRDAAPRAIPDDDVKPHLCKMLFDTILNKAHNNLTHQAVEEMLDSWGDNQMVSWSDWLWYIRKRAQCS